MSHEKVKSIAIKDNKVFVTGKCNNDTEPMKRWHCTYFDPFFEQGIEKVEIEIMKAFESGNFQSIADNKYTRALRVLRENPEYINFDWRAKSWDHSEHDNEIEQNRNSEKFDELIRVALRTKLPKQKIIIQKDYYGTPVFVYKKKRNGVVFTHHKESAKVFSYMQDAKKLAGFFEGGKDWNFITL